MPFVWRGLVFDQRVEGDDSVLTCGGWKIEQRRCGPIGHTCHATWAVEGDFINASYTGEKPDLVRLQALEDLRTKMQGLAERLRKSLERLNESLLELRG